MSNEMNDAPVVRAGVGKRVFWSLYGSLLALTGVAGGTWFAFAGLWPFALFFAAVAGAMAWISMRSARVRLLIRPDHLLVANQLTTKVVQRDSIGRVEIGRSSNPLHLGKGLVLVLLDGSLVRVDATARFGGDDGTLQPLLERLRTWRTG